ncbi:histone H3.3-H4 chaperone, HIR complex subunit Hip3 [Schizosaccharomyces osmophilus]|uniref:Histone H3.3-H4 chaperone, HIR complex subunit Hip3 n=1 Tax=Schizosaccharomyces osmophilus TaxID=2545709 RepID=A0AAF0AW52_9SCHI|nr:histone H3.3-H4 chaperone, HIR complex subunit Hip3 [Schizosaccharomyces osmophilus]WBW72725.1 histone H3.3-H4 chaperone, HIR complex subunit Hip3 [Schizosaccharomyces osmophilus]
MASFTPLNAAGEDLDKEKRTLEIRIEEALQIYQNALVAQKENDWDLASKNYEDLLNLRLLRKPNVSHLSRKPRNNALLLLHYLVRKNHGEFLFSSALSKKFPFSSEADVITLCRQAINDFSIALACDPNDIDLWTKVAELAEKLHLSRVLRFALESSLYTGYESFDPALSLMKPDELNPGKLASLQKLCSILKRFHVQRKDIPKLDFFTLTMYTLPPHFPFIPNVPSTRRSLEVSAKVKAVSLPTESLHGILDLILNLLRLVEKRLPSYAMPSTTIFLINAANLTSLNDDLDSTDSEVWPESSENVVTDDLIYRLFTKQDPIYANDIVPPPLPSIASKGPKRPADDSEVRSSKRSRGREPRVSSETSLFLSIFNTLEDLNVSSTTENPAQANPFSFDGIFEPYKDLFDEYRQLLIHFPSQENVSDTSISDMSANGAFSQMMLFDLAMQNSRRLEHMETSKDFLSNLIMNINNMRMVPSELAAFFVRMMLEPVDDEAEIPLYMRQCWGRGFKSKLTETAIKVEDLLYSVVKQSIGSNRSIPCAQSLFEIFLDDYFQELKINTKNESARNENSTDILESKKRRCIRWKLLSGEVLCFHSEYNSTDPFIQLKIRFEWARNLLLRLLGSPNDSIVETFLKIKNILIQHHISFELLNSHCMPDINIDVIDFELSKLQTIEFFNTLFMNTKLLDYNAVIENLEPVLLCKGSVSNDNQSYLISQFLVKTSTEFQIHLWGLLREAFNSANRPYESILCSFYPLQLVLKRLGSVPFSTQNADRRKAELLGMLKLISHLLQSIWHVIRKTPELLDGLSFETTLDNMKVIIIYLKLFSVYAGIDDVIADDRVPKPLNLDFDSYGQNVKDTLLSSWCIFYRLCARLLQDEIVKVESKKVLPNILTLIHSQFSFRGYCGFANGSFLELSQTECQKLDVWENENEILQCVFCRFGLMIGSEYYLPQDHQSPKREFSREDAVALVPFVLGFAVKRSHGWIMPRSDQKHAFETICDKIGPPNEDVMDIYLNKSSISNYLETDITAKHVKFSLVGRNLLKLQEVSSKHVSDTLRNMYYSQAQVLLGYYRARLKGTRCITELNKAATYALMDLYINPFRQDSWYTAAVLYLTLADEELSWSADLIGMDEEQIIDYQRKGLLCYLMAISLKPVADDSYKSQLYFDFGACFYSIARPPLEMSAFYSLESRVISGSSGLFSVPFKAITSKQAIAIAADFLSKSFRLKKDWKVAIMLAKSIRKLGDMATALEYFEEATNIAPKKGGSGSQQTLLLEPHYALLSNLSKAIIENLMPIKIIFQYLTRIHFPPKNNPEFIAAYEHEEDMDPNLVINQILLAIQELRSVDKQSWQHRPTYRIAKLLDHLGQFEEAKKEMEKLISFKSSGKSLVNIWRTYYERPGRYFYYGTVYSKFFISLLYKTNDDANLLQFMRRFRRSSPSIYDHRNIWLNITSKYINDLRDNHSIIELKEEQRELMPVSEFNVIYEKVSNLGEQQLSLLIQVYELRKLNNGLYPTTKLDDFLIDCFMDLYGKTMSAILSSDPDFVKSLNEKNSIQAQEGSAKNKSTNITRKEIISKIIHMCRPSKDSTNRELASRPSQASLSNTSSFVDNGSDIEQETEGN